MAFVAKENKKKSKKGPKGGIKQQGREQKKYMRKVKCFAFQKFGHYVGQFPNKKKKKQQMVASTDNDEYVAWFEREFSRLC